MKVNAILNSKGRSVYSVVTDATVAHIITELSSNKIGFLVVLDKNGELAGVISERDIVHRCMGAQKDPAATTAIEIMTPLSRLVTASETDDIGHIMAVMTERKVRHLPILKDGTVIGIVSIGDVIKYILEEKNEEIRSLMEYVSR
jgi:CBS domain-containing protein